MWKLIIGFIVFAALALFVIMKGGDKVDMSGEKHTTDTAAHAPAHGASAAEPAASAPAAAAAASVAAPAAAAAASAPASAASGAK